MIRLEIRAYCRPFKTPLLTVHGPWKQREGLILKLTDGDGRITYRIRPSRCFQGP